MKATDTSEFINSLNAGVFASRSAAPSPTSLPAWSSTASKAK